MKIFVFFIAVLATFCFMFFGEYGRLDAKTSLKFKTHHESLHENGKSCDSCHENSNGKYYVPDYAVCIGCHGDGETMAEATKDLDPNPHTSSHYGTDVDCTACHSEHGDSVAVCTRCHLFEYKGLK